MTTTRELLEHVLTRTEERPEDIECFVVELREGEAAWQVEREAVRCSVEELPDRIFDDGYGGTEGDPFIGFGPNYVYVRGCYDGAEWIEAVPRNPETVTAHNIPEIGGG